MRTFKKSIYSFIGYSASVIHEWMIEKNALFPFDDVDIISSVWKKDVDNGPLFVSYEHCFCFVLFCNKLF